MYRQYVIDSTWPYAVHVDKSSLHCKVNIISITNVPIV